MATIYVAYAHVQVIWIIQVISNADQDENSKHNITRFCFILFLQRAKQISWLLWLDKEAVGYLMSQSDTYIYIHIERT